MNFKDYNISIDLSGLSGCAIAAVINEIGYNNIAMFSNHEDLLNQFSDEQLIDHLINNNDRAILEIAEACIMAEVELNSLRGDYFRRALRALIAEIYNDNV